MKPLDDLEAAQSLASKMSLNEGDMFTKLLAEDSESASLQKTGSLLRNIPHSGLSGMLELLLANPGPPVSGKCGCVTPGKWGCHKQKAAVLYGSYCCC